MKTYLIKVYVHEEIVKDWEFNLSCAEESGDEEDIATCKENIEKAKKWENTVPVTSLQEYFSLLSEISEFCDGEYRIYNNGLWISVGE